MDKIPSPGLNNGRRTLAVIGATMASTYNTGIAFGAADYAQSQGWNIVVFPGGPPNNPDALAVGRSRIFEFAEQIPFDAAICTLGSLARFMNKEQIKRFLQPYSHKPVVIVGRQQEGCASVVVDNVTGMREILVHLIEVHGKRKIAFAGGQTSHTSTMEKLETYKETLAEYGIEFDPAYVIHGELNRHNTDAFVQVWLDERKLEVDAIVTVNDRQSFAILQYLQERGLRVPEDIAVTGCMDMLECSLSNPTLTTVHEPMYELGWNAAKTAIDALENGADWQAHCEVPTRAIFRQSCGCMDGTHEGSGTERASFDLATMLAELKRERTNSSLDEFILQELARLTHAASDIASVKAALNYLEMEIGKRLNEPTVNVWLARIPVLQHFLSDRFEAMGDKETAKTVQALCEALQKRMTKNALSSIAVSVEKSMDAFRELLISLNSAFDVDTIRRLMVREIHIRDCFINLYKDNTNLRGEVKNILSLSYGASAPPDEQQAVFPAAQLVPANIVPSPEPFGLIVLPLSFRIEPIGYAVLNLFDRRGVMFETMQALLASALKNEIQILEVKAAQASMMQSEKMAALGSLVAGISHEINTPVGVILTGATVLSEEAEKFKKYIEIGAIKKSELMHYTDTAIESAQLIQHNAERAAALIQSFKRVAVDQTSEARRTYVLQTYIHEVIVSLQPAMRHSKVKIEVECDKDLEIDGYPGAMAQIITNMVTNANNHAFPADFPGVIKIQATEERGTVRMTVSDNGQGIPQEHLARVFDPFFTTRRGSGGSGLGLNIVYNLVTQTFGGTIAVTSSVGEGVTFHISFPRVSPVHQK